MERGEHVALDAPACRGGMLEQSPVRDCVGGENRAGRAGFEPAHVQGDRLTGGDFLGRNPEICAQRAGALEAQRGQCCRVGVFRRQAPAHRRHDRKSGELDLGAVRVRTALHEDSAAFQQAHLKARIRHAPQLELRVAVKMDVGVRANRGGSRR
jgi:hypothetical protein